MTKRHLRKLFWNSYRHDKEMYVRMGGSPAIVDDHCNLALPPDYKQGDLDNLEDLDALFMSDTRLSIIKSQVVSLLLSVKGWSRSNAEVLRDVRQLDGELENWRMSVPSCYRPSLAPSYTLTMDAAANDALKVHIVFIHMEYYTVVSMIHTASSRCPKRNPSTHDDNHAGVKTSQDIAFQAGRLTIATIQAASQFLSWNDLPWVSTRHM